MTEWISVKDRLPEKADRYLVYQIKEEHSHNLLNCNYPYPCCECNVAYFSYFEKEYWQWDSFTNLKCNPTHWMSLPLPPEKND